MSWIGFEEDCIITACAFGHIRIWDRPRDDVIVSQVAPSESGSDSWFNSSEGNCFPYQYRDALSVIIGMKMFNCSMNRLNSCYLQGGMLRIADAIHSNICFYHLEVQSHSQVDHDLFNRNVDFNTAQWTKTLCHSGHPLALSFKQVSLDQTCFSACGQVNHSFKFLPFSGIIDLRSFTLSIVNVLTFQFLTHWIVLCMSLHYFFVCSPVRHITNSMNSW